MNFWDASAVIPLLVQEPLTPRYRALAKSDSAMVVWWGTSVECVSAIARYEREARFDSAAVAVALRRLDQLAEAWAEVPPSAEIRPLARRLLRVHTLRAADALQLAAALVVGQGAGEPFGFACCDHRLAVAGDREGLRIIGAE